MGLFSEGIPISGEELANFLRHNVADYIWRTYSGNTILRDLRAVGSKIGESAFFQIRGEILGFERFFANLGNLGADSTVPRSWYIQNHGWQLSQKFLYNAQVDAINNRTGQRELFPFSWSSDHELTVGDIMLEAKRALEQGTDDTDWTVVGAVMRFALNADDAGF